MILTLLRVRDPCVVNEESAIQVPEKALEQIDPQVISAGNFGCLRALVSWLWLSIDNFQVGCRTVLQEWIGCVGVGLSVVFCRSLA